MKESTVIAHFTSYLRERGWDTEASDRDAGPHTDLVAKRGSQTLIVEAKGTTTSPGTDMDTAYGQLLRRINPGRQDLARYALLIPATAAVHAQRVHPQVRASLNIELWTVHDDGTIEQLT